MGGHGGLNILPHKTWNVYGREQRARVDRDEAAAADAAAVEARRAAAAAGEARRAALLKRAAERAGARQPLTAGGVEALFGGAGPVAEEHPDARVEEREAAATRGDKAQRTSDARVDAAFALGGGRGRQATPWYARAPSAEPDEDERRPRSRSPKKKRRRSRSPRRRRSRSPRHHRRSRRRSRTPPFSALRAEREAREAAEAARAADEVGGGSRRRYWSAFGNKPPK